MKVNFGELRPVIPLEALTFDLPRRNIESLLSLTLPESSLPGISNLTNTSFNFETFIFINKAITPMKRKTVFQC